MAGAQLVISLVTIICSGVVAAIVTYKLNSDRQESLLLRKKLEELTISLIGFCNQLGTNFLPYLSVMNGEISFNQALDIVIDSKETERYYHKVAMIINIYFPNFSNDLEKIHSVRNLGNKIINDFKYQYKQGKTSSKKHLNEITDVIKLLGEVEENFKLAIRKEAKKIMRDKNPLDKIADYFKKIFKL